MLPISQSSIYYIVIVMYVCNVCMAIGSHGQFSIFIVPLVSLVMIYDDFYYDCVGYNVATCITD